MDHPEEPLEHLEPEALLAVASARARARERGRASVTPDDLLAAIVSDHGSSADALFALADIDVDAVTAALESSAERRATWIGEAPGMCGP